LTDALDAHSATRIRRAQPADAAVLTGLALTSKAVWGYDASFMAACRAELTITPERIPRQPTHVIEQHGQVLGFYQLRPGGAVAEVAQFFIAPAMLAAGSAGGCGRISTRRPEAPAPRASRSTATRMRNRSTWPWELSRGRPGCAGDQAMRGDPRQLVER
jgi:hypothetical protein